MKFVTATIWTIALSTVGLMQGQDAFERQAISMTDGIKKTHPTAEGPLIPSQKMELIKSEHKAKASSLHTNKSASVINSTNAISKAPKMVKEGDRWVLKSQP